MNSFVNAVNAPKAVLTTNGMKALDTTGSSIVDLFYNIGASRNAQANISAMFSRAFADNKTLAARTLFWARDVRSGAGERQTFRNLMLLLEKVDVASCKKLIPFIPEYGRWDDVLVFNHPETKEVAYNLIKMGLLSGDGLCAKWAPRKGVQAAELRKFLKMTPKQYRKTLVSLSNTVEQKMCAQQWDMIDFGKLPSVASKIYMTAFHKNAAEKYTAYKAALVKGEAKINAGAIYPHDVIRGINLGDADVGAAQWEALPNYLGDDKILPMVDVSGSMTCSAGGNVSCLDVAVALGLYIADKQPGAYNGMFLTFSAEPQLIQLRGNIKQKMSQMISSQWGMNTNIAAAFNQVLRVAVQNRVAPGDMPKYILIMSDMQFDRCANLSGIDMITSKYTAAGYEVPKIVFWNLNASYGNQPVSSRSKDVALISGFSPAIMKSVLKAEKFDPISVVLETINSDRYSVINLD